MGAFRQDQINDFRKNLLAWYDEHQRDLPWRKHPSVYKTVVSEFMLQQTQVKTVLPYFDRWLTRFPGFQALATADEQDVLKYWEGLGYYARARNLHKLAKAISEMSKIPSDAAGWIALPGVGEYTCAAIGSIAQNLPLAVVDGNVVRVLARLTAETKAFNGNAEGVAHVRDLANTLLDPARPGDYNQALMELGATVCTKANPACDTCPVVSLCQALKANVVGQCPNIQRRKTEQIQKQRAFCVHNGQLLVHRIESGSKQLSGLYELPEYSRLNAQNPTCDPIFTGKRGIGNRMITESFYPLNPQDLAGIDSSFEFHPLEALEALCFSGPHRRWLKKLLSLDTQPQATLPL